MRRTQQNQGLFIVGLIALWALMVLPALAQSTQGDYYFPEESFVRLNPTLPNSQLNFDDDSQESCCANDYSASGQPLSTPSATSQAGTSTPSTTPALSVRSDFERANPRYQQNSTPAYLVACERFADIPELASSSQPMPDFLNRQADRNLPIVSYSTNVSRRLGAEFFTDPAMSRTSDFHIETIAGNSQIKLQGVNSYSVCMARGNNVAMIANTDSASIITYNGSDHVYLSGDNTNMFTRTGAGEDLIELHQAHSSENGANWTAFNIYKSAVSGGSDTDTLVIKGTPPGTKWCHIGGYRIYGEYFHVVEFALPPSVTDGPRRQRVNIGQSVEYVIIKGKRYHLNDFLAHGQPVDTVARSIPVGDPLPRVAVNHPR